MTAAHLALATDNILVKVTRHYFEDERDLEGAEAGAIEGISLF